MSKENIFEINLDAITNNDVIQDSNIYIIDNFYQHPEKVLNFFLDNPPSIHKRNQKQSYNQVYFDDRRHRLRSYTISHVYKFLGSLCNQKSVLGYDAIVTNFTRFRRCTFNNYRKYYWWPHIDEGYTGILYLSDDNVSGTNLYNVLNYTEDFNQNEHTNPWRSKDDYEIIVSLEPKFNRMVLFDGLKFCHGMNICNHRYFSDEYRMNQVFFFKQSK
jgi:hypothetical protein